MFLSQSFDPLSAKYNNEDKILIVKAIKREIKNILSSYRNWFDPFSESIQNALDSIDERANKNEENYNPSIWIKVDLDDNSLTVTDNGIGLDKHNFESFLAPNVSNKPSQGKNRGRKGVGATYLAYGFNHIKISTKTHDFQSTGKMLNARHWVDSVEQIESPRVVINNLENNEINRLQLDQGVSIYIKFDKERKLSWLQANDAKTWLKILRVKTGLGAIENNKSVYVYVEVVDRNNSITVEEQKGINYLWTHELVKRSASISDIQRKKRELLDASKDPNKLPNSLQKLDVIYDFFTFEEILPIIRQHNKKFQLTEEELDVANIYSPHFYFAYTYSEKLWDTFNQNLNIRGNYKIFESGIQLAANNMPQGEFQKIVMSKYLGRSDKAFCLAHFNDCEPDVGRKSFEKVVIDFTEKVTEQLINWVFLSYRSCLKASTGGKPSIEEQERLEEWKSERRQYANNHPLLQNGRLNPVVDNSKNIFDKLQEEYMINILKNMVTVSAQPSREQDVIALFNQLIGSSVIRGIFILATNENSQYDSLYQIKLDNTSFFIFDKNTNPLGVLEQRLEDYKILPFESSPKVLEYKYSVDKLIEDISDGKKNSNEIDLVVVWETGDEWKKSYKITSLLDETNREQREYHGITHLMTNLTNEQKEMNLIVLKELIDYILDPKKTEEEQISKYDEEYF